MTRQESYGIKCPFCSLLDAGERPIISENAYGFSIEDKYPVSPLHCLIIPKRHVTSFFDIETHETSALVDLLEATKNHIEDSAEKATDIARPTSFNIGINDGVEAGQTILHLHIHLIPRYPGDMQDPRGGVRWIFPEKANYWKS